MPRCYYCYLSAVSKNSSGVPICEEHGGFETVRGEKVVVTLPDSMLKGSVSRVKCTECYDGKYTTFNILDGKQIPCSCGRKVLLSEVTMAEPVFPAKP